MGYSAKYWTARRFFHLTSVHRFFCFSVSLSLDLLLSDFPSIPLLSPQKSLSPPPPPDSTNPAPPNFRAYVTIEYVSENVKEQKIRGITKAAVVAFPHTTPIGFAWFFLGLSYGLLMSSKGFSVWYTALMATVIFAGSLEFVTVDLLLGVFNPITAFLMALMVNARFLFYGLAMLTKYKGTGKKKWYLIFGLTDETFAGKSSADIPEDVNRSWFYFFVTLFSHCYWVLSSVLGSLVGPHLPFNTRGIDFVLTAMFVTIFLDEWLKHKRFTSALAGILVSLLSLILFGKDSFLIPTMLGILTIFTIMHWENTHRGLNLKNSSVSTSAHTSSDSSLNDERVSSPQDDSADSALSTAASDTEPHKETAQ